MKSLLSPFLADVWTDIRSANVISALSAGVTSGIGLLVAQIALATYIFSGPLAAYTSKGVGLVLFGNFVACLVVTLTSGYRGAIAGLSPALVICMVVFGQTLTLEGDALFATASAMLILCCVITALICLAIGHFRWANLLRFIPYPVTSGFVAGIGGAVCLAAFSLFGTPTEWATLGKFLDTSTMWLWLPGLIYGIGLYLAIKRWRNPWTLPVSAVLLIAIYHVVRVALGWSVEEAQESGMLLSSSTGDRLWPALAVGDLLSMEWSVLISQLVNILIFTLVALICVVMNIAGLETAANQDLNWDREFRSSGFATLLASLGGSVVATIVVPASFRSKLLGAATRLTGICAALVIGSALLFGDGFLGWIPTALVGGILVFAGLGMLDEGLVRGFGRIPWSDFGIILLIFIAINVFGLLEGIAVGMLATLAVFTVRLSRIDPIASTFTTKERRSNKDRSVPERAILHDQGDLVHVYRLRGYLFFGSVSSLVERLKRTMRQPSRPRCLLLDFTNVSGFDFSSVVVLARLLQTSKDAGTTVALSALPDALDAGLRHDLSPQVFKTIQAESNLELALEFCEDILIADWHEGRTDQARTQLLDQVSDDLELRLERRIEFESLADELQSELEVLEFAAGETLISPAKPLDGLHLITSGQVTVYDDAGTRLCQCGQGEAVWPRSTSGKPLKAVVEDSSCQTMLLTNANQERLQITDQDLLLRLYRYLFTATVPLTATDESPQSEADTGQESPSAHRTT